MPKESSQPPTEPQTPPNEAVRFDVHPSVVFQLGEHLISDANQALLELIKNAYDADATYVKLTIQTDEPPPAGSRYPNAVGYILVEDDGHGMSRDAIKTGWLVIANSAKRGQKAQGITTPGLQRTPLGDKGLGRLGVQRLGHNVEIATRPSQTDAEAPGTELHVAFSWDTFRDAASLGDVSVLLEEAPRPTMGKGTRLLISGLTEPDLWRGQEGISYLREGLSQLLSPYGNVDRFRVYATLNGTRIDFASIGEAVRRTAQVHYDIVFDGSELRLTGRARLSFFRPPSGPMRARFRETVEADGGAAFLEYMTARPGAADFNLKAPDDSSWFVIFSQQHELAAMDGKAILGPQQPANPGPFHGEIDGFNLGAEAAREAIETIRHIMGSQEAQREEPLSGDTASAAAATPVFDSTSEYNKYVKDLSGVRIYRDGFGIRVDRDWLDLADERTSGKSYYSLRPGNTLGYIALSARDNGRLTEKTDREGFQASPYYNNFSLMLETFVKFSGGAQAFLRRSWVDYEKAARQGVLAAAVASTPTEIAARIHETLRAADSLRAPLRSVSVGISTDLEEVKAALLQAEGTSSTTGTSNQVRMVMRNLRNSITTLADRLDHAQTIVTEVETYLAAAAGTNALGEALVGEITGLQDRLDEVYEMVGLGLTAEALSHELGNVASQLAARTQKALVRIRKLPQADGPLITYAEYVQTAVNALRKQLSHLAPSLKYVRDRREDMGVEEFLLDLATFHRDRLVEHSVSIDLASPIHDFTVSLNRGKLTQVFDNLLLNSEYWLREEIRSGELSKGVITLAVDKPYVRVSDNGRGISQTIEHRLFSPFVTAKKRGEGRGLGLFITRQLLDSEGCSIALSPDRNEWGNLFLFELNLAGALIDRN